MVTERERPLQPLELGLLKLIASHAEPHARALAAQISKARVLGGIPTLLRIGVDRDETPVALPDGPLPVRALVDDRRGRPAGEVLVWIKSGYVTALEYAWVTDQPPAALPPADAIRIIS